MSNSCFRTCTIVLIYCAVLLAQVSVTVSAKDSQKLIKTRRPESGNTVLSKQFYINHPSLRNVELSDEMRSLLFNLKRKKRVSHHGRMNKHEHAGRITHPRINRLRTSTKRPIISIDYVESPISKETGHESQPLLDNNDIVLDDLNRNSIYIARRDVRSKRDGAPTLQQETTVGRSTPSFKEHSVDKKYVRITLPPFEVPLLITGIDTDQSTKINLQKRQAAVAAEEPPTTCVTLTGITNTTVEITTAKTTLIPISASPAVVAAQPGNENETCDSSLPCHMSDTLSEILENVESLADAKLAQNEDFPCNLNGSWISEAGGVRLDIIIGASSSLEIRQGDELSGKKMKVGEGFMRNATWALRGTMPLENKGMIIINGVNEDANQLATFIGECKVCHHSETVAGHWLYAIAARDCNNQKNNFKILSDLWRRESLHTLKRQFLRSTRYTDSTTHKSTSSITFETTPLKSSSSTTPSATTTAVTTTTVAKSSTCGLTTNVANSTPNVNETTTVNLNETTTVKT